MGPNSGSCWTEPVRTLPTVISSVGTGGWAQSSFFLPLSCQNQTTFYQLVQMDKNPTQSFSIHNYLIIYSQIPKIYLFTLYWICCCLKFPSQAEIFHWCIMYLTWFTFLIMEAVESMTAVFIMVPYTLLPWMEWFLKAKSNVVLLNNPFKVICWPSFMML